MPRDKGAEEMKIIAVFRLGYSEGEAEYWTLWRLAWSVYWRIVLMTSAASAAYYLVRWIVRG